MHDLFWVRLGQPVKSHLSSESEENNLHQIALIRGVVSLLVWLAHVGINT
jgi:hypothetical protein